MQKKEEGQLRKSETERGEKGRVIFNQRDRFYDPKTYAEFCKVAKCGLEVVRRTEISLASATDRTCGMDPKTGSCEKGKGMQNKQKRKMLKNSKTNKKVALLWKAGGGA